MWRKLLEEGSVEWEDIQNKPKEYPPKQHSHKEYAESKFIHNDVAYDLQDVVEQITVFLEKKFGFKLQ